MSLNTRLTRGRRNDLEHGIVSHNEAKQLDHTSVARAEIQDIRKNVVVPNGMALHDYVAKETVGVALKNSGLAGIKRGNEMEPPERFGVSITVI